MRLTIKRLACILLVLLTGIMPRSLAEEAADARSLTADHLPTLHISVQYEEPSADGIISGTVTVSCDAPLSPGAAMTQAPDVVVFIETEEGLTLLEGAQDTITIGDIPCGTSRSFSLTVKYDSALVEEAPPEGEDITPLLRITAESKTVGGCRYTCLFDITPKPRALLLGMNTSANLLDTWQFAKTQDAVKAFFTPLYYDGQPMEVTSILSDISDPSAQSFSAALETLKGFPTDDNDISYLYLNAFASRDANGSILDGFAVTQGMEIRSMTYANLFAELKESIKGRLVVLTDSSNADAAVSAAVSAGMDPEKVSVVGLRIPERQNTLASGDRLQGMLGAALRSWQGDFTTAQGLAQTLECEEQTDMLVRLLTDSSAEGVWFGSDNNVLFAATPEYRSRVFLLAVKEETAVSYSVMGDVILTAEISEHDLRSAYTLVVTPTVHIDGYDEASETFNSVLHSNAIKALDNAAATRSDPYVSGHPRHEYEFTVNGVYAVPGVVSVLTETYEYYSGGAHGIHHLEAYNFSPERGWFISLQDLLDPDEPRAFSRLRTMIINQLALHYDGLLWDDLMPEKAADMALAPDRNNWFLTREGLVLCFNEYEIGPYSIGMPRVLIPWAQLRHIFDQQYLPREIQANGTGSIAQPGDERLQSDLYTDHGTQGRTAFVADGTLADVCITYVTDSLIDSSVIFYANGLSNAWVSLPQSESSMYRVDWKSESPTQSLYIGINEQAAQGGHNP